MSNGLKRILYCLQKNVISTILLSTSIFLGRILIIKTNSMILSPLLPGRGLRGGLSKILSLLSPLFPQSAVSFSFSPFLFFFAPGISRYLPRFPGISRFLPAISRDLPGFAGYLPVSLPISRYFPELNNLLAASLMICFGLKPEQGFNP